MASPTRPHTGRRPIALYLLLANGITWLCWIPSLLISQRQGYLLPTMDAYGALAQRGFDGTGHVANSVVFSLAVYGPLIAALIATSAQGGREAMRALLATVFRWRVHGKWYGVILVLALALAVLPLGLGLVMGMVSWAGGPGFRVGMILFVLLAQMVTSGLGEEPGWRGFLLPALARGQSGDRHIWLLGLFWAIWHYPFTLYVTLQSVQSVNAAQLVITLIMALAGQTMSLIGLSYVYAWLVVRTDSVWLAILFHGLSNALPFLALQYVGSASSLALVQGATPWLLVLAMRWILGKGWYSGSPMVPEES